MRAAVLVLCLYGLEALACPTCVGPRLGDSSAGDVQVQASVRSTVGSDRVTGVERLEWANELGAGLIGSRFTAGVGLPYLWRRVGDGDATAFGDLTARGSAELVRRESPDSSDTLRLLAGLGLPTSRGSAAWRTTLGTQSVTPSLGLGFRHSDQDWALSAVAWGALPFALPNAPVAFGPSFGTGAAAEYEPWRWLRLKLALDLKQQLAAREGGWALPESQFFVMFLGGDVRVQPVRWLAATAGIVVPLVCVSPGGYEHGRIYRLGVELTL
ncbi:MAG: hypothetical protein JNK82_01845 [Myxococcaceae bacterium]|nr:hypothetical protein [Myxococcaceae bacterium]